MIAAMTSTAQETSVTLLTGAGRLVYTIGAATAAWQAADASANAWVAANANVGWTAGEVTC